MCRQSSSERQHGRKPTHPDVHRNGGTVSGCPSPWSARRRVPHSRQKYRAACPDGRGRRPSPRRTGIAGHARRPLAGDDPTVGGSPRWPRSARRTARHARRPLAGDDPTVDGSPRWPRGCPMVLSSPCRGRSGTVRLMREIRVAVRPRDGEAGRRLAPRVSTGGSGGGAPAGPEGSRRARDLMHHRPANAAAVLHAGLPPKIARRASLERRPPPGYRPPRSSLRSNPCAGWAPRSAPIECPSFIAPSDQ